jgi:hypothetical protein
LEVDDRAQLQKRLDETGIISTGIQYPIALHLTRAYKGFGFRAGDFSVVEKAASHVLLLPILTGTHLSPAESRCGWTTTEGRSVIGLQR